jgi:hypothetical protein
MATLEDGVYTIFKTLGDLATLRSVRPGEDVVLLPPANDGGLRQRVMSISLSHSQIRSYDILLLPTVGGQKNTKGNLYHNQPGEFSVIRRGT